MPRAAVERPKVASPTDRRVSIGRFIVLEPLGRQAAGRLYRAYDPVLRRELTLKLLPPVRDADAGLELVREAQAMARLAHPNLAAVYDVLVQPHEVVLAMEYVPGQTLPEWLSRADRSWRQIVATFERAGHGLVALHEIGLAHRDLRSADVVVSDEGVVKVADVGLAGARVEAEDEHANAALLHVAPEQHRGDDGDARADQYAFCAALWEALCGQAPFRQTSPTELLEAKLAGPPPWPAATRVPRLVSDAIRRGLAPSPARRWPSMQALLEALRRHDLRQKKLRARAATLIPVAALAGAGLTTWQTQHAQLCAGSAEHLASVWSGNQRAAVTAALLGTDVAYAADTAQRVQVALDTYASQWADEHRESCEATRRAEQSPEVMDLRMACLHRHNAELRSVVDLLSRSDADVVKRAFDIVAALPPVSRCADVEVLRAGVPPPAHPVAAQAVAEAREILARGRVLRRAAKYDEALELVEKAQSVVERIDYAPVSSEIAALASGLLYDKGKYLEAETAGARALTLALASGATHDAARIGAEVALLVGDARARHTEGLRLVSLALGLLELGKTAPDIEAALHLTRARLLTGQGRFGDSESQTRESILLLEKLHGPDHPSLAAARSTLGSSLTRQARFAEAEVQLRRALEIREKALGPAHPHVAEDIVNVAIALAEQGDNAGAEREFRHAIAILGRALGAHHPSLARLYTNLSIVLRRQREPVRAEAAVRRAIEVYVAAVGEDNPSIAIPRSNLATYLADQGKNEEAAFELRSAIASYEKSVGPDHPFVGEWRTRLCEVLLTMERPAQAEEECRRALGILETALHGRHPNVAKAAVGRGRALAELGRLEAARTELERGFDIVSADHALPEDRAYAAFALAQLLWRDRNERARALGLARAAQADFSAAGELAHEQHRDVTLWLQRRSAGHSSI